MLIQIALNYQLQSGGLKFEFIVKFKLTLINNKLFK